MSQVQLDSYSVADWWSNLYVANHYQERHRITLPDWSNKSIASYLAWECKPNVIRWLTSLFDQLVLLIVCTAKENSPGAHPQAQVCRY